MVISRLIIVISLTLLSSGSSLANNASEEKRPDVLFIMVDDLNDWVGVLGGHPQAKTPNIDRLASRGLTFTNAHAAAPLCNPSRTALLTGLSPFTSGVYDNRADWRDLEIFSDKSTLPKYFKDKGYRTYGAGKIFHAHTYSPEGFEGNNDPNAWTEFYPSLKRQLPEEIGPTERPSNGNPVAKTFDWQALTPNSGKMGDTKVAEWVVKVLKQKEDSPRFIAAGIYRPHLPWYTPQKFFDMHPLDQVELPSTIGEDLKDVPKIATRPFLEMTDKPPMAEHEWIEESGRWKEAVQAYLASISYADAQIGKILDALDESGRAEETVIVLLSDHGFHLGEKLRWRKDTLWEDVTRVPLIIVAPSLTTAGSATNQPASLLDLYPTLAALIGNDIPEYLDGDSLVPLLSDQSVEVKKSVITAAGFRNYSVRTDRYRFTRWSNRAEELYDHKSDPHEWHNLAPESSLKDLKSSLARELPKKSARPER